MIRVLLIGSFLSKSTGSYSVSEKLANQLQSSQFEFLLVSNRKSKIPRLLDVIFTTLTGSYDIVHIDTFSGQAFRIAEIASKIALYRKKKTILTLHGGRLPEYYEKYPRRLKNVFARASYIQTPSFYLLEFFRKRAININYLPNSIKLDSFPYSRGIVNPHTLLWVRAFTRIYNPDLAVRTLKEVQKKFPDTKLTMIGPDKGSLKQTISLIEDLDLTSAVFITGPVKNDVLYKYYQTHDVFLNTTSYESFGVAVLEAAACGIPIVSTKVGEIPYLYKHEEDMLIVEGFDPIAIAHEICKLFQCSDLSDRLSKNARKVAERFAWDNIKPQWELILGSKV